MCSSFAQKLEYNNYYYNIITFGTACPPSLVRHVYFNCSFIFHRDRNYSLIASLLNQVMLIQTCSDCRRKRIQSLCLTDSY